MASLLVLTYHSHVYRFNVLWDNAGLDNGEGQIMGDMSEIRGMVVILSFIGVTVFLIGLIPTQFVGGFDYEGRTINPEDYWEALDLQSFADTLELTLNDTGWRLYASSSPIGAYYSKHVDLGGHDFDIYYSVASGSVHYVWLRVHWTDWIIIPHYTDMDWINNKGIGRDINAHPNYQKVLPVSKIQSDYDDEIAEYTAQEPAFRVQVYFGYNTTLYSSIVDAWDNYELQVLIGIDFDQTRTGYNAWELISMLLFFQLPDIHWTINALIAIPLWISIGYISFILILRALGAIFGGGGA